MDRRFSLVGPGRAGMSFHGALLTLGWQSENVFGVGDDVANAAQDVDLCVVAVPDRAIRSVAAKIAPGDAVVMHISGATPVSALSPHRAAALHPLLSLADPDAGATALTTCYFACGGDPLAQEIAEELSGKWFRVDDDDRALYHAAAAIGSNHLVALLGQVERVADEIGVPLEAFMALVQSSVDNVARLGPKEALTGPAARGDDATVSALSLIHI